MCDLQKFLNDLKEAILNFRLDLCCFVFSVRAGILLCGFFNVISNMVSLIAVSTGVLPPLLMNAQQSFMDGEYIKSTCAFAYSADLCLAVLLLCGMYRKDIVLLRYYTYCGLAMLASTLLVYSMVIGVLSVLLTFMLVVSLTYQVYIILLVRSVMVELKHEASRKNYYTDYPMYWKLKDVEAPVDDSPVETYEIDAPVTKKTPEIAPATEVLAEPTKEAVKDAVEPITIDPVKDTTEPKKSEVTKEDTKPVETPKATKPLRYPYKFVAIKIPKEDTIKEEKENEDKQKEIQKEAVVKAESKEATKDVKKQKRSIFGRKIKSKPEYDKPEEVKKD